MNAIFRRCLRCVTTNSQVQNQTCSLAKLKGVLPRFHGRRYSHPSFFIKLLQKLLVVGYIKIINNTISVHVNDKDYKNPFHPSIIEFENTSTPTRHINNFQWSTSDIGLLERTVCQYGMSAMSSLKIFCIFSKSVQYLCEILNSTSCVELFCDTHVTLQLLFRQVCQRLQSSLRYNIYSTSGEIKGLKNAISLASLV